MSGTLTNAKASRKTICGEYDGGLLRSCLADYSVTATDAARLPTRLTIGD